MNTPSTKPRHPKPYPWGKNILKTCTAVNCMVYSFFEYIRTYPNATDTPFYSTFGIVFNGILYNLAGGCFESFAYPYGSIVLNILLYSVNCHQVKWRRINCIYS